MLVAPAMNPRMWAHPATRETPRPSCAAASSSSAPTRARRPRASGAWAGWPSPREIAGRAEQLLAPGSLAGKRVLVTAGGTREPLDAARFVGNRSSGRMGVALAEEARRRGAEVVLLAANLAVPEPHGVETIPTPTAEAMLDAARGARRHRHRAARRRRRRLPPGRRDRRQAREERRALDGRARARPPTSRGGSARRSAPGQLLVTFGADLGDEGLERKREMLTTKNADLVVFNDVSRSDIAFESADNEVVLVSRLGERPVREGAEARDRRGDPRRGGTPARR